MRTLTAQQLAVLQAEAGYGVAYRVRVLRSGTWHNLSALTDMSLDFLSEASLEESTDAPVATASVRCAREVNGVSLAPLVTSSPVNLVAGSYSPLLLEGRTFVVETAVVPLGMEPGAGDWLESFRGRIDEVDVGGEGLSFKGRDYLGGLLQDTFIKVEREYGSDTGVDAERVMAAILSDNLVTDYPRWQASHTYNDGDRVLPSAGKGTGWLYIGDVLSGTTGNSGTTEPVWPTVQFASVDEGDMRWYAEQLYLLYVPTSPSWMLGRFIQRGEPLMDALATLAAQLGWEVRYRWNTTAGAFRLTFWKPNRAATTADWTFTAGDYEGLSLVRTSLEDVRNSVEVVYSDRADLDVAGNPKRKTVALTDSASIAELGERFSRLAEASTSNIDSAAEATTLAQAFLGDMATRPLGLELEVGFHPGLELGDLVAVEGNGYHFTGTQQGAVQVLTHTFDAGGARTKVTLLGKPSTSVRRWLSMEQRPTTAPASPFTGPSAPTGLTSSTTAGGFKLSWSPPTAGPVAAEYELHVSTSSSFTPSDSTRRVVGKLTEMVVTDLTPGTTYYAKVVPRDYKGNRGTASAEQTLVPRYVEPRTLQPRVTYAALPLNSDFEAANDASTPPDTWEMATGAWGTDATADTTFVGSGVRAVKFTNTAVATKIRSAVFLCREYDLLRVTARLAVGTAFKAMKVWLRWLDADFAEISLTEVGGLTLSVASTDYSDSLGETVEAPATTCYAQVVVGKDSAEAYEAWVDTIRVFMMAGLATSSGGYALSYSNSFGDLSGHQALYNVDPFGFIWFQGAITRTTASSAGTVIATLPAGHRPASKVYVPVATDSDTGGIYIETDGTMRYARGSVTEMWLSGVRFRVLNGG